MKGILGLVLGLLCWLNASANDIRTTSELDRSLQLETPEFLIKHEQPFYGLAFIYNAVQPIYLANDEVVFIDPEAIFSVPEEASHVGWKSRYQLALVAIPPGIQATFDQNRLSLTSNENPELETYVGAIDAFEQFEQLKYAHLWDWLRAIALAIEWLLVTINQIIGHWGWSVLVLAVVMKLLMLPVSLLTLHWQRHVSKHQTLLAPQLQAIKQKYSGEQAHNAMMAAHKELGITPFYTMKPMLSNFIQIPILVAVFNVLGELGALQNQAFLWIKDLSLPDTLFELGFAIPWLGTGFNLLPFLMTMITVLSTVLYKNDLAPESETQKQKINLYLMAVAFFVLFYPFPAAMVLYWAMANVLQFMQQKLMGN